VFAFADVCAAYNVLALRCADNMQDALTFKAGERIAEGVGLPLIVFIPHTHEALQHILTLQDIVRAPASHQQPL
jgi:hypothetical protein